MKNRQLIGRRLGLCCTLLMLLACDKQNLADFAAIENSISEISIGDQSGGISKTNELISIPIRIGLNSPASKAFEVGLQVNQDTISKLIADGSLKNNISIDAGAIAIPNVVKVAYGADSAQFVMHISRTALEKYYGKTVAVGYTLTNAGKGNQINGKAHTGIIQLNTRDLLTDQDIHYLSTSNAPGGILEAKNQKNYESSSSGLTVPIGLTLASFPGSVFSVKVVGKTDTLAKLIAAKVLPANTLALNSDQYFLTETVNVPSNTSTAPLEITIPWSVISQNIEKYLAVVVQLESSTLHVINPKENYTIVLVDCANVMEVDVTNDGIFSVNRDNGSGPTGGEGSLKLIDNNYNSKFLQGNFTGDLVFQLIFDKPQKIGAYTLTSGGDAIDRDPNAWNLQGSNDGLTWETVDNRSGEAFPTRNLTRRFDVFYPAAYTHYRLNITSNVGSSLFQLSEWRMVRIP